MKELKFDILEEEERKRADELNRKAMEWSHAIWAMERDEVIDMKEFEMLHKRIVKYYQQRIMEVWTPEA